MKLMIPLSLMLSLGIVSSTCQSMIPQSPISLSLSTSSTWREYPLNIPQLNLNKEKWVWTCSITFKSKEAIKLTSLILQWRGEKINDLSAALYQKKECDNLLVPIEQNLVCDGHWDKFSQQLVFSPNEKIVAVNKYYLMISFPKLLENKIKHGKFAILTTSFSNINQSQLTASNSP